MCLPKNGLSGQKEYFNIIRSVVVKGTRKAEVPSARHCSYYVHGHLFTLASYSLISSKRPYFTRLVEFRQYRASHRRYLFYAETRNDRILSLEQVRHSRGLLLSKTV